MSSERTVREVVDLMIELGLIDPELPAREPFLAKSLDEPLSYYGDTEHSAVRELLSEVGIRYTFDYKTFRGISGCAEEERRQWYESELRAIADCSRGMVTITDVRLVENDMESELRFESNGITESWPTDPGDDEHFEASLTFATYLTGIPTGRVEQFCDIEPMDKDISGEAVFGDPRALNRLGAHFGLNFWPME
ncbi:hypothetical protein [Nocardia sp. X0981]